MGIWQRLTARTATPAAATLLAHQQAPGDAPVAPVPASADVPAAVPTGALVAVPASDREVVHTAAPPVLVVDGHWWTATPRLVCNGTTYVAGAKLRAAAVAEAQRRYGRIVLAQLVADPSNPHHARAVAVWVGDLHVGYVRRSVVADSGVRTLRRLLDKEAPVTVWARIEQVADDAESYLGVTLLHELIVGAARTWPFPVVFPPVDYAKVTGKPGALAALLQRLSSSAETDRSLPDRPQLIVPATVSVAGHGSAARVQVAVDGELVGTLSAAASAKRITLVQQVLATGRPPIAQLRLRSNAEHSKLTTSLLCPEAA